METSILKTIRQMIGPSASYDVFDTDLIIHINTAFSRLCQLGIGPKKPFKIIDDTKTWEDFVNESESWNEHVGNDEILDDVKQYLALKVRMIFDPPESSIVTNSYKEQIDMLEQTLRDVAMFGY